MKGNELKNADSEDLEDLIVKIEHSFGIQFDENELTHVQTFGELCDEVKSRIELEHYEDCTSQQAFYKLRKALSEVTKTDRDKIIPNSLLSNLLPRKYRRAKTMEVEKSLGFKINLLRAPYLVTGLFVLLLLASLIGLAFVWQNALLGLGLSFVGLRLSEKWGMELDLKTVGELAEKMTRENYMLSRRNPKTFNKAEIEAVMRDLFSSDLNISESKLSNDERFDS